MEQDIDLDLGEDNTEEIISRKDKKINSLSEKFRLADQERADLVRKESESKALAESAQKERDFFKNFNSLSSKYPQASEHQDDIWAKVQSGYTPEDAALSVLVAQGKYTPEAPKQGTAAGGSADTAVHDNVEKTPDTMSRAELTSALKELEAQGGFKL